MSALKSDRFFILILILGFVAVLALKLSVKAYRIPSGAMEDTIETGDFILVNKASYLFGAPHRGDIIVFEYPVDRRKDFIKRVVGMPGDTVVGIDKRVFVNGKPYDNPHELHKATDLIPKEQNPRDNFGPVTVPADSYFVMGDNRDNSYDSRFWGFVKRDEIRGRAFIKYWSWDKEHSRVRWGSIGRLIH